MQGPVRGSGYEGMREGQREEPRPGAADGLEAWLELRERRMHALEAENHELRRQLEALRRGAGIFVVIDGQTIALEAPAPTDPRAPAVPNDTRPEAARRQHTGWQATVWPEDAPATSASVAPGRSGYVFEQQWLGAAAPVPTPSPVRSGAADSLTRAMPVPPAEPSLPSMPTSLFPVPALPASGHRTLVQRAPRTGAADDSWLTDQPPVPPVRAGSQPRQSPNTPDGTAPAGPRPRPTSRSVGDDTSWLRTGAAWPDTTPRHPVPSARPAFPPQPRQPANPQQPPVRAPRTNRQDPAPGERPSERNIFADSFIL